MSAEEYSDMEYIAAYVGDYRKQEAASKQAFETMTQSLTPPFKLASRQCEDQRTAVLKCYQSNPVDVFMCQEDVKAYTTCTKTLFGVHLDMVDKFQAMRDEHRRSSAGDGATAR